MNANHLTAEQIAYVSEMQLSGKYALLSEEIKQHLQACNSCAIEVLEVNEISTLIAHLQNKKRNIKLWASIAAAASLLIIITISFLPQQINHNLNEGLQPQNIAAIQTDTTIKTTNNNVEENKNELNKPTEKKLLAKKKVRSKNTIKEPNQTNNKPIEQLAHYKPDDHLESLVERAQNGYLRSAEPTTNTFNLIYPEQKNILLINNKKEEFIIEIYTNKGRLVIEQTCTDTIFTIPNLDNGLYYYKLINADFDLLMVGRITIKK